MVRLTKYCVEKKCLQIRSCKSLTRDSDEIRLDKMTHLFMNDQNISEIDDISVCKNLRVIYLHNNSLQKIENLDFARHLTHLYLQCNCINKIENLKNLANLQKLFLGQNCITVIEGLENLKHLQELHVEKQQLDVGEKLCFDPRNLYTLAKTLQYLNVSDNKIESLRDLANFERLKTLEAKNNFISDIGDLTETISTLVNLKNLFLQGNPVTKTFRYRENLVANSDSLSNLDDKSITENSRAFLKKFRNEKYFQLVTKKSKSISLSEKVTDSIDIPSGLKKSVSKIFFQTSGSKLSFSGFPDLGDFQPQLFPAWKTTNSIQGLQNQHLLPRPFWKNKKYDVNDNMKKSPVQTSSMRNRNLLF